MTPGRAALALLALFLVVGTALAADPAVQVTARVPIEKLDANGEVIGAMMSAPGTSFTLVQVQGDRLELRAANGSLYRIDASGTDFVLPRTNVATAAPAMTNQAATAPTPPAPVANATPPQNTPPPDDSAALAGLSPQDAQTVLALNRAFGLELFSAAPFWDSPVETIARRLAWPPESATTTQVSYRSYCGGLDVLGTPAYSLALYGRNGKAIYVSLVFSNLGDFPEAQPFLQEVEPDPDKLKKVRDDLAVAVKAAAQSVEDKLTAILGPPSHAQIGNSSSNREDVHRWDWNDVAFLFDDHQNEYATLRIIPVAAADREGTIDVMDGDTLRGILAGRVVHRPNGDVVLSDIPMVDQGPKGYCVPATWERYLRYLDIPADLYVLAMLGGTEVGGTSPALMRAKVDDYANAYHRHIEVSTDPPDIAHVATYIDQGLPLMWDCWVTRLSEAEINVHTHNRRDVSDWTAYAAQVEKDDQARELRESNPDQGANGHERMIIGYNATSHELAISDSWGSAAAERWISEREAHDLSQGGLSYIRW